MVVYLCSGQNFHIVANRSTVAAAHGHTEIVKYLAPLTNNPNAADEGGVTPIHTAAMCGKIEIIKILVPLTKNPNAADERGVTPIFKAAMCGKTEIIKILAPLADNPNAPNKYGRTPIEVAWQNEEIQGILKSFINSAENCNVSKSKKMKFFHFTAN